MKWLKSRKLFLNEAKIGEIIFPSQAKIIKQRWGSKYLTYEEVTPTKNIIQGTWKLSEEDKNEVLNNFMNCDVSELYKLFSTLPDTFVNLITESIDVSLISNNKDKFTRILQDFNIKSPNLDQILIIRESIFRKIALGDTMSSSVILKDDDGRPIKDENNQMVKVDKAVGEIYYTKNLTNINSFLDDYNSLIEKFVESNIDGYTMDDIVDKDTFRDNNNYHSFVNYASDTLNSYKVDFEIFNRDIYLKISHNPKDILNMSISSFYSSCQHLYSGMYASKVLGNVFDSNSMPAYLLFDTPIYNSGDELISDHLPLSRMIIRNIESFDLDDDKKIYFDRAYPDRMQSVISKIVEKYSKNKNNYTGGNYYYLPDIDLEDDISHPYQDRLELKVGTLIGRNIKTLKLTQINDWSRVKVDPDVKLKELVIETDKLPPDILKIKLNLDWVKFRYLSINSLDIFKNLNTTSYSFDKCKISNDLIKELPDNIKKLQIISCDISEINLNNIKLDELHLIYTLDSIDELVKCIENIDVKILTISGDLAGKENKSILNSIKSKGVKIKIVGPVI